MPAQSQAPSVSSDPHNPAGAAPQLGIAETGSQHAGDSAPKNSPGWVIGAIVSALLVVVFFCTAVFAGMQLRAKNLELREAAEHETSAHNDLDRKQRELDKVKKDLEEIQK
jgi:protein transport protein SEC31